MTHNYYLAGARISRVRISPITMGRITVKKAKGESTNWVVREHNCGAIRVFVYSNFKSALNNAITLAYNVGAIIGTRELVGFHIEIE